tara:strand:+ start:463 stop:825 length:363 start_codon:yes stop_codon:yes gene_type:complete
LENGSVPSAGSKQAVVRMIAAPIGPLDLDGVVGSSYSDAPFPRVGGNEGVGVVESVGKGSSLKVGDWVIPAKAGLGITFSLGGIQYPFSIFSMVTVSADAGSDFLSFSVLRNVEVSFGSG